MTVFHTVLNMSITGAYIAAAIILLRLFMKKLPKKYSYALWIILGIRLLCPFSLSSAVSLFNIIKPETTKNQMMYIPEDFAYVSDPRVTVSVPAVNDTVNGVISENLAPQPNNSAQPIWIVSAVCDLVWLTGFAAMVIYTVVSYALVRRKVKNSRHLQDNVYICKNISSPFVYGVFKPRIYLPENIPATETDFILAHERAHIKRGDHIVKLIAMAALSVHWFNPMAWISYKLMIRDMELSCDEIAVSGFERDVRKDYAETLLNMSMRQNNIMIGGILAFGESNIKTRIKSVLSAKKPRVIVTVAAVLTVVISSVCLLTNASSHKLVKEKVVRASITQVTTLASVGGDTSQTVADPKAAAKLINSLSAKEIGGRLPNFDGTDLSAYTLTLYYDEAYMDYDMITIFSPVQALNPTRLEAAEGAVMAIENDSGEKVYTLSKSDYMKLAEFMTEPFEMFPEGVYMNNFNRDITVVISEEDGEKTFTYLENGTARRLGAPDSYDALGAMAVWGDFAAGGEMLSGFVIRYEGNNMLKIGAGRNSVIEAQRGVFVMNKAVAELSDEIYQMALVPVGYEAHALEIEDNPDYGVYFMLPEDWTVKPAAESDTHICASMLPLADFYRNGTLIGSAGYLPYKEIDGVSDEEYYKTVYGGLMASSAAIWDIDSYTPVTNCGRGKNGAVKLSVPIGSKIEERSAVLSYAKGIPYFVGLQFIENALTEKQMKEIYSSVEFIDKKRGAMLSVYSGSYTSLDGNYKLTFDYDTYVGGSLFEGNAQPNFRFALFRNGEYIIGAKNCGYDIDKCMLTADVYEPPLGEFRQYIFTYEKGCVSFTNPDMTQIVDDAAGICHPAHFYRENANDISLMNTVKAENFTRFSVSKGIPDANGRINAHDTVAGTPYFSEFIAELNRMGFTLADVEVPRNMFGDDIFFSLQGDINDANDYISFVPWSEKGKYYITVISSYARGIPIYETSKENYDKIMAYCNEVIENSSFGVDIYNDSGVPKICADYLYDYWNGFCKLGEFAPEKYISDPDMLRYANARKEEYKDNVAHGIDGFNILSRGALGGAAKEGRLWLAVVYDLDMIDAEDFNYKDFRGEDRPDDAYKGYTAYFELEPDGKSIYRAFQLHELGIYGRPAEGVSYPLDVDISDIG